MPKLIAIYGPPFAGKSTLACLLARSFDEKAAVVSADYLLREAIAVPDAGFASELEMVHTQLRLLVANYLKNRYNVVVEGAFVHEHGGAIANHESEVDQLVALMRNLTQQALFVRLSASDAVLSERARAAGREGEADSARRIAAAYRERYGVRVLNLDSGSKQPDELAAAVQAALD